MTATALPEFTPVMRGYDRAQVDEYVAYLLDLVADADERAQAAEEELELRGQSDVGQRITKMFDLAAAEAADIRERSYEERDELLNVGRREAQALLEQARDQAAQLVIDAHREREDGLADLDEQRDACQAEVARLEHHRTTLVAEVTRLRDALTQAAATVHDGLIGSTQALRPDQDAPSVVELPVRQSA